LIRRTSLAMALVNDPEVAFLDEPTVGMDPQSRRATWDLIGGLGDRGRTVILTTHYIEEAEALADRVGIIDHGRLIALDAPRALMDEHGAENLEEVFMELTGRRIREEV
jgi:ABC-2 type transport system ATP-binding protein